MKKLALIVASLIGSIASVTACTQRAPGSDSSLPVLYVDEFRPATQTSSGFGPLHLIASGLHAYRADKNAAALEKALLSSLTKLHVAARLLPAHGPLPSSGWLVSGVFYSLDNSGHIIQIPFLSTQKSPNVEVTVTLADCAKDARVPFAVLGTDSVLKGQSAPVGWNPYVVGARFVIHRIEGDQSLNALADQIASKIVQNQAELTHRTQAPP